MRRLAWGPAVAVAIATAAALAGCDQSGADDAIGLCTTVCRCAAGALPSQQRECVDECVVLPEVRLVSNACVECVYVNADSCSSLIQDCFNNGPCNPQPDPIPPVPVPVPVSP